MKIKILLVAMLLSVVMTVPGFAQEQETAENNVSVTVGNDSDFDGQSSEEFIAFMRGLLGDTVADRIQERFAELDAEDRAKLEQKLSEKDFKNVNVGAGGMGGAEAIVAIIAISLSLGMPIIILLLVLYFSYRKRRQRMDLIQSFVDAGKDVPEQLLNEASETDPLRSGINLVAIGLGLVIALYWMGAEEIAAFGLIPLFIGLARLGYYYLGDKNPK